MEALILAAGIGRRMWPLSRDTHKCLLRVGGETILGRMLRGLVEVGIEKVAIVTGYRADEIESYAREHFPEIAFTFVRNERYETTNNIYSMHLALEALDLEDDVLLIESDLVVAPGVLAKAMDNRHDNVALVSPHVIGLDGTVVELDASTRIKSVVTPSMQSSDFEFSGTYKTLNIYKFSRELCRTTLRQLLRFYVESIDANAYYELVLGILIYLKQVDVHGVVVDPYTWAEIDDPNDLHGAEWVFNPPRRRAMLDAAWGGMWTVPVVDFAFLRNMYFPTPAVLSELRRNLPDLLASYGSTQSIVDAKLSYFLGCDPAHVVALNGASQCFPLLGAYFGDRRVLLPEPTFGEYRRVFPRADAYVDACSIAVDALAARAKEYDLVVVVNPNNPTGTTVPTSALLELVRAERRTTWLVDESFLLFSGEESLVTAIAKDPGAYEHVIVLQSLSKTLGVPGARLGFLFNTGVWANKTREQLPVWNMNSVAENLLEIIVKHRPELASSLQRSAADRVHLARTLRELRGVERVVAGGGNFVLVELALSSEETARLADRLAKEGIYVKDVSAKMKSGRGWLRLAVRTPSDHERLARALQAGLTAS
ncbi:MAG TPA: aminotransferase class I/II-fold pyridoxal phosphate-dependent enzyme [Labilithrix sp.]|nr:aminotransferase class I/II-fold pyridoxal phosphate-dependent enzyme [Labilithrix sp.]